MPKELDSCVKQVKSNGKGEDSAYAICTDSLKKTAKDGKFTQAEVAYSYRPPGQQCQGCKHYEDGSSAIVEGKIKKGQRNDTLFNHGPLSAHG